jgi:hypothetical protein
MGSHEAVLRRGVEVTHWSGVLRPFGKSGGSRVKLALLLLFSLLGLCGCAHQYLMKLNNGDQIISLTKPKHQGTTYHFTDRTGAQHVIPESRVLKIRAVSVVNEEGKPGSQEAPAQPKKPRHWYLLWLACGPDSRPSNA